MRVALICALITTTSPILAGELPVVDDFRIVPQYPEPAAGADLTLGAALTNTGQLVLWDGDTVYVQEFVTNAPGPLFQAQGSGYVGNPSFVAVQTNNRRALLGDGDAGIVYEYSNLGVQADFSPDLEIPAVTHDTGTLLSDRYLIFDRIKDDLSGAELVVLDLSAPIPTRGTAMEPPRIGVVLEKPANSMPAKMSLNGARNRLFVTDSATGELRSFEANALSNALLSSTMLSWETDGELIVGPGETLFGGVAGVNPQNELVLQGDMGALGTGGIQIVAPGPPVEILLTFDPAGDGPPFEVIYNRRLDEIVALDPTASPPDAYATFDGIPFIPPDAPSDVADTVRAQFAAFLDTFAPGMTDLDGDEVRDSAMLELMLLFSDRNVENDAIALATNSAFDDNLEVFAGEANAAALADFDQIIPVLLLLNAAMQDTALLLLADAGLPLSGTYDSVSCDDLETCFPEFVEDPFTPTRGVVMPFEPYFGTGDPDDDGLTNLEEFQNSVSIGGQDFDFAIAAASNRLNGLEGVTGGSTSGGCFIATAAYGSPLANELKTFRAFRDERLLPSRMGALLANAYYRVSPFAAEYVATQPIARTVARSVLDLAWGMLHARRVQLAAILALCMAALFFCSAPVLGRENK